MSEQGYVEQYIQRRRTNQHGCLDVSDAIDLLECADAEIAALQKEIENLKAASIHTCHEHYGDQMIPMEPALARAVGLAMIRLADKIEAESGGEEEA